MWKLLVFSAFISTQALAGDESIFKLQTPFNFDKIMTKSTAQPNKHDDRLESAQKAACRRTQQKMCLHFTGTVEGTAFVFQKSNLLLTSLHTFKGFLAEYWRRMNGALEVPVPIVLYGDGGTVVFGDRQDDIGILHIADEHTRERILNGNLQTDPTIDFVWISLSRAIGYPLQAASKNIPQTVQVDGFDWANGFRRQSVRGQLTQPSNRQLCLLEDAAWNTVRFATYPSEAGLSGSPVRNGAGEVVGVHTGRCSSPEGKLGYFIPIQWILNR